MKKIVVSMFLLGILLSANAQVPSYVPSNGLVGWWPFNGNANDESGNGNHGTVNGASLTNDRNGVANSAYSFDGINDQIYNNSPNSLPVLNSKYTISAWFQTDFSKDRGTIVGWGVSTNPKTVNVAMYYINKTLIHYHWQYDNSISYDVNNEWHHIAITYNQSNKLIYVDGELIQSFTCQNINVNASKLFFGKSEADPNQTWPDYLKGQIDDIGIWNRDLTANEVKLLYKSCIKSITQQPLNQGMFSGQAKFTCKTNDTLVSYQWETNTGTGWSKLFNAGQYSGVTTDTLKVSNVTSTNNNQLFRCIIKGDCLTDTTEEVSLKVWGLGVNSFDLVDFKVYPNPSSTQVIIDNGNYSTMGSYNAKIVNALGQTVFQSAINQQQFVIDAKTMGGAGVYTLYITDANNKVAGVKKIVLQ